MVAFCAECFGHADLRRRLSTLPAESTCPRHGGLPAFEVEVIAEIIEPVYRAYHYVHENWEKGEDLTWSLSEFLGADEDVAKSIADILIENEVDEDPFFDDQNFYEHHPYIGGGWENRFKWSRFREDIIHRRRFFGLSSQRLLEALFSNVHMLRDKEGVSPIHLLSQGTTIYRGRVAENREQQKLLLKDPRKEVGPPPVRLRRAGRMNPAGIPAFYGALDGDTCVAELRPAKGRSLVMASFSLLRPIWVMDISFFDRDGDVGDIFGIDHLYKARQWNFMAEFMDEISASILPEDETLEYIPTQAVAEYLSNYTFEIGGKKNRVEALVYPSAQKHGGRNIVLLGDAASVEYQVSADFNVPLIGGQSVLGYIENSAKALGIEITYSAYELKNSFSEDIPF
jgi:hypothetical protein